MRRRALLAGLAAGLSGCSLGSERTPSVTPATVPEGRADEVARVRTPPPGARARGGHDTITQEVSDRTLAVYTDEAARRPTQVTLGLAAEAGQPTWLVGALLNTAETTVRIDPTESALLGPVPNAVPAGRPPAETLYLAPREGHDLSATRPPVERGADGRWRLSDPTNREWIDTEPVALAPGERLAFAYVLVGRRDGPGFPTGRYRFEGVDRTVTVAVWPTSAPGPTVDSRFPTADPPALPVDGVPVWYHESGPGTAIYLDPSTERVELPASATYRLVNHARSLPGTRWLFAKLVDGEWFDLTPTAITVYRSDIVPGEAERWDLSLATGAVESDRIDIGFLGGGRYAFVADVGYSAVSRAALLAVDAPPLSVTPDKDLRTTREGVAVTVTDDARDADRPATLTVRPTGRTAERVIPEQVARHAALRNTLPFFEDGVETVVLRTDEATVREVLGRDQFHSVRVDGASYRLRRASG